MRSRTVAVLGGATTLAISLIGVAFGSMKHPTTQVDLSRARGVQNEASVAVDPANPELLVAASQDTSVCGIRTYASGDGGRKWSSAPLLVTDPSATRRAIGKSRFCAFNQWVGAGRDGRQYVVFAQSGNFKSGHGVYFSSREYPEGWSRPRPVDPTLTGNGFDDKPVVAVDNGLASPHSGRIYVAWTRWVTAGTDGRVVLSYSDDQGQVWSDPVTVGSATGANWGVHPAVASDGTLYATAWNGAAPGVLWIARSTDGGASFEPPLVYASRVDSTGVNAYVAAEPTQPIHSDASLAVDTSTGPRLGTVYAAYSRRTGKGFRVVVTAFNGNLSPERTHQIAARPTRHGYDEFNATIAVDESNGTVWACFYLTGTGKQRKLATYSCIDSRSGGRTWSRVLGGASVPSNEALPGAFNRLNFLDNDYASYEGLAASGGSAHPVWTDTRKLKRFKEEIYSTRLREAG